MMETEKQTYIKLSLPSLAIIQRLAKKQFEVACLSSGSHYQAPQWVPMKANCFSIIETRERWLSELPCPYLSKKEILTLNNPEIVHRGKAVLSYSYAKTRVSPESRSHVIRGRRMVGLVARDQQGI